MRPARLKVGLDTSCLVPLFVEEHDLQEPTKVEWHRLRGASVTCPLKKSAPPQNPVGRSQKLSCQLPPAGIICRALYTPR